MRSTRRELLRRGGLLAAGLTVGSWAGTASAPAATTTTSAVVLGAERRETFAALADTVLGGPSLRLPASATAPAVDEFAAAYTSWPAADRRRADHILDALGRDFRRRERAGREAQLRGGPRAADALALVGVVLATPDGESHVEVTL